MHILGESINTIKHHIQIIKFYSDGYMHEEADISLYMDMEYVHILYKDNTPAYEKNKFF